MNIEKIKTPLIVSSLNMHGAYILRWGMSGVVALDVTGLLLGGWVFWRGMSTRVNEFKILAQFADVIVKAQVDKATKTNGEKKCALKQRQKILLQFSVRLILVSVTYICQLKKMGIKKPLAVPPILV